MRSSGKAMTGPRTMTETVCLVCPQVGHPAHSTLEIRGSRRPRLLAPPTTREVRLSRPAYALPWIGRVLYQEREWTAWELPVLEPQSRPVPISIHIGSRWTEIHLDCSGTDPRPEPPRGADNDPLSADQKPSTLAAGVIGRHVELARQLFDAGGTSIDGRRSVDWSETVRRMVSDTTIESEAPVSLVVRVAEHTEHLLESLCTRPRRMLRRYRTRTRLDRARQLDPTCVRWLASRPGRTIAERADAKERILAVVREDAVDTLENRVLRDFLLRSQAAGRKYLGSYADRTGSTRLRRVRSFTWLTERLARTTALNSVSELHGIPEPNYTLLFDDRYRLIWQWYLALVQQDRQEEHAWVWRHRLWGERCRLSMLDALLGWSDLDQARLRSTGDLAQEQDRGRFLAPGSTPGPWLSAGSSLPKLIAWYEDGLDPQSDPAPKLVRQLGGLGADCVLTREPAFERGIPEFFVAIFSALEFEPTESEVICRQLERLTRTIHEWNGSGPGRILLLVPTEGVTPQNVTQSLNGRVSGQVVPISRDRSRDRDALRPLLSELVREGSR